MTLLLIIFVIIVFWGNYSTSSHYVLYTSDCEGKCVNVYGDGSMRRDMSKTLKCKDCYPKLKQTLDSTRAAVGGSKLKFEFVEKEEKLK